MPTFFVATDAIAPPVVRITGPLVRHLRDSLRLQPGEPLLVSDGCGRRYRTEVTKVTPQAIESQILETATAPVRATPQIVLGQAILKGEKMDWVVQKATELGVDCIVPLHTKHGVVKIQAERVEHQRTRWQRIALEAAQQSERWTVPTIDDPADLSNISAAYPNADKLMLAERSSKTSIATVPLPNGPGQAIVLLIGPEGGWDEEEQRMVQKEGFTTLTLGSRILRAETAAIAALSILQSRLGELG